MLLLHTPTSGSMLDGAEVEVTLAKPVDKDTYLRSPRQKHPFTAMPAIGFVPVDQYGTILPAFYPGYYSPPKYVFETTSSLKLYVMYASSTSEHGHAGICSSVHWWCHGGWRADSTHLSCIDCGRMLITYKWV